MEDEVDFMFASSVWNCLRGACCTANAFRRRSPYPGFHDRSSDTLICSVNLRLEETFTAGTSPQSFQAMIFLSYAGALKSSSISDRERPSGLVRKSSVWIVAYRP